MRGRGFIYERPPWSHHFRRHVGDQEQPLPLIVDALYGNALYSGRLTALNMRMLALNSPMVKSAGNRRIDIRSREF